MMNETIRDAIDALDRAENRLMELCRADWECGLTERADSSFDLAFQCAKISARLRNEANQLALF